MKSVQDIVDLASAYYGSAVLFAAIDNNVFARIEAGEFDSVPRCVSPAALDSKGLLPAAGETHRGTVPRGLRLLLDACVAEGLLTKSADGVYANTPASRLALIPGGPADLTKAIRYNRDVYPAWGKLAEFAQTGKPVEKPEIHLGEDAARTKAFAASMFGRAMGIGKSIVPMLELVPGVTSRRGAGQKDVEAAPGEAVTPPRREVTPGTLRLLDLAGGPAAYAILMCQANPSLAVTTVDLPAISAEAANYVAQFGLAGRIACRAGDYHTDEYESEAYDVVTIFGALHQESSEQIVDILKRAHRALKPGGRVIVLDMMTDETHTAPKFSALFALNMALTTTNGWVFSDAELKDWMREAGFEPGETQVAPPPMPHWLVSAVKK